MAFEFRRSEPGTVIYRDGLTYHWAEGGEWLPALQAWHAEEADSVGIEVREVDDPPLSEPVPVVEVPVLERAVSVELPDDTLVEATSDEDGYEPVRPRAVSRTVRLPETQVYEGGDVTFVDVEVTQIVQPGEYVPPTPMSDEVVTPAPTPAEVPRGA